MIFDDLGGTWLGIFRKGASDFFLETEEIWNVPMGGGSSSWKCTNGGGTLIWGRECTSTLRWGVIIMIPISDNSPLGKIIENANAPLNKDWKGNIICSLSHKRMTTWIGIAFQTIGEKMQVTGIRLSCDGPTNLAMAPGTLICVSKS